VDTLAQPQRGPVVRLAELQIDPARLDEYKAALREEIESSIRVEPGVLTLYAVSVKGHPDQIRMSRCMPIRLRMRRTCTRRTS